MRPCWGIRAQMLKHQSRRIEVAIEALLDNAFPYGKARGGGIPAPHVDRARPAGEISALTGLKSVTWGRIDGVHAIVLTRINHDMAGRLTLSPTEFRGASQLAETRRQLFAK
jgi:hypothetical protein